MGQNERCLFVSSIVVNKTVYPLQNEVRCSFHIVFSFVHLEDQQPSSQRAAIFLDINVGPCEHVLRILHDFCPVHVSLHK